MSRETSIFLLGLIIIFLPIIGIPPTWKNYSLLAIGLLVTIIGLSLRRSAYIRRIREAGGEWRTDSFVESQPSLLDTNFESPDSAKEL